MLILIEQSVEIAATSRDDDLGAKAELYASAGIADYWVLDLRANRIFVHREPIGRCSGTIAAYPADEAVTPLAAATASLRLQDLSGEAS